jgi:predicted AAA+ superfamily ATPase
MVGTALYPRFASPMLEEALKDTAVVLVHGPRQCGKTTLARTVGHERGYGYITFDDDTQLAAATEDPAGFVAGLPPKVVLDEVQRVPQLFLALKASRTVHSHGLVERAARAHPGRLARRPDGNRAPASFIAVRARTVTISVPGLSVFRAFSARCLPETWCRAGGKDRVGGFPAAVARATARRRQAWYRDYVETLVQRDVRNLARISNLDVLPRLLQLAASQSARLLSVAELGGPFQLSRPTIRDYVTLLERIFLLEHLPPWYSNKLSRLVKTPKLHVCDTGLAAALLGFDADDLRAERAAFGQLLETFVFQELRRQVSWQEVSVSFFHFRDKDGAEVDVVLERGEPSPGSKSRLRQP